MERHRDQYNLYNRFSVSSQIGLSYDTAVIIKCSVKLWVKLAAFELYLQDYFSGKILVLWEKASHKEGTKRKKINLKDKTFCHIMVIW